MIMSGSGKSGPGLSGIKDDHFHAAILVAQTEDIGTFVDPVLKSDTLSDLF